MSASYRSHSVAGQGAATSWVVSKPAGAAAGDVCLVFLVTDTATVIQTVPTGWTGATGTPVDNAGNQDVRLHSYYRILDASDAGTASWTW